MKVEVDADELFELKQAANTKVMIGGAYHAICADGFNQQISALKKERYSLLKQVEEMKDVNGRLRLETSSRLRLELDEVKSERDALRMMVRESAFHKLRNERDWWRDQARSKTILLEEYEDSVCEKFQLEQPEGFDGHLNPLLTAARNRGYKVPE